MEDIKALKEALEAMLRSASMHAGDWESREGDVNEWGVQCYEVDGERVQELATAYGSTTAAYIATCSPARIARLLERLEAAERDAALWRKWLPYLSMPRRKPFDLARDCAAAMKKEPQQ